jgi:nicotinate dehydrogenase subunit A
VIELTLNGSRVSAGSPPDTPLLTVLRDELGLLGTRFGCGLGLCGACLVNLDGAVVASCDTPLWQADGRSVTTVEGLTPHPVQEALLEHQAAQCGFCVSGMVVAAAALLEQEPSPSRADVVTALDRNLCRCGSHNRIVDAICGAGS